MEKNDLTKFLLEKYYLGKTSLNEEKELLKYLKESNSDNVLYKHRILLETLEEVESLYSRNELSKFDLFEKVNFEKHISRTSNRDWDFLKYTAIILLMIGSFFLGRDSNQSTVHEVALLKSDLRDIQIDLINTKLKQSLASDRIEALLMAQNLTKEKQLIPVIESTVLYDDNINVCLMSLDLLKEFQNREDVKRILLESFRLQDSPIIRTEIIRILEQENIKLTQGEFKKLKTELILDPKLNDKVSNLYKSI